MANENLKAQEIYGIRIKDLPQVTEVNDTDDIIIEDSTPITRRVKIGTLFGSVKNPYKNKTIVAFGDSIIAGWGWKEGDKIVQTWTLTDDPVYPEPELSAEEALNIIMGVVQ